MTKSESELATPRAIAAYLLLIVSCVAGLFQNSSMVADAATQHTIQYILMIATGIGVPVAIMFAAPYLGLMLNFQTIQTNRWLTEAREKFDNSRERKLARRDLMAEQVTTKQEPAPVQQKVQFPKVAEIVAWYRREHGLAEHDTNLSAAEIAKDFYAASKRTPVNGDLASLSGAIRTQLSRERNQK